MALGAIVPALVPITLDAPIAKQIFPAIGPAGVTGDRPVARPS